MSKLKSVATVASLKRSRPITAWLKKECLETSEVKDDVKIKLLPKVCLQPLNENICKVSEKSDKEPPVKIKNSQNKSKNNNENQSQNLRRSIRNLPPDQKPVEEPEESEPVISSLSQIIFTGRINFTNDFYEIATVCDKLLTDVENNENEIVPVGFDLEWPFSFQTGSGKTALAQICLSEKECHLLHLFDIKILPTSFIQFLSHPKIKLVGVNIKNDVWKLTRDFKEFPGQKVVDNNCLDCGPYVNSVINRSCRWSLERLTAYLLKKKISKDPSVRNSKWHIQPLSEAQKLYAATDAYVSLLLHLTIEQKKVEKELEEAAKEEKKKV